MDQNLQHLALAYAAALVDYHTWLPAQDSGFHADRARFMLARDRLCAAQEALNDACKAAAL
jgi:hypothetical protein